MIRKLSVSVLALLVGAVTMLGLVEAGTTDAFADGSAALVEPFDAGAGGASALAPADVGTVAAPAVTVNAGSGATVNVAPAVVPDPVEDPGGAIAALTKLYKDGALTAFFILLGFFALVYAERKIEWLRTGYRKVVVASVLYGLGMIVERAITGTTPNLSMLIGAIGAALVFAFKSYGAKPTQPAT